MKNDEGKIPKLPGMVFDDVFNRNLKKSQNFQIQ